MKRPARPTGAGAPRRRWPAPWWRARRTSSPTSCAALPLAIVVVTLVGSVTLPARETHRITRLLREGTEVLAPARLLQAQLQFGLARELGSLQRYALSGDGRRLEEYRLAVAEDERRLVALEQLAPRLDVALVGMVAALRSRIGDWRSASLPAVTLERPGSPAEIAAALELAQARHEATLDALGDLSSRFAAIAAARDDRVQTLEQRSLAYNATLVFAALVATGAVTMLTIRERRLTATLRLRAEEANEGRQALERVMRSRSRLIRGFSHDVKNPIGAADGFAELLSLGAYGELATEQHASVARLRGCLQVALSLIDELHELGRAETGNVSVTLESVDLGALLGRLGEEFHAAAHAAGLSLTVEVDPALPVLQTDGGRVRQIVSNLLSNAIKYTGHGSIRMQAYYQPPVAPYEVDDWACITVADTGPGIPSDKQAMIFEEFSRLAAEGREGAGLGLAISKLLAQALGGHLSVESEVGRGSAFTLRLPMVVRA